MEEERPGPTSWDLLKRETPRYTRGRKEAEEAQETDGDRQTDRQTDIEGETERDRQKDRPHIYHAAAVVRRGRRCVGEPSGARQQRDVSPLQRR